MKLVLALLLLPCLAFAGDADQPDVAGAIRLFDTWMRGQMIERQLPGVEVGIIHDQQLIWTHGYGYADVDKKIPMTAATKFRMASHSKLFTSTAIMQLREAGKLQLDDPITKYLPWLKLAPLAPGDGPITIEELLTHTSGLPREAGSHWSDFQFPDEAGIKDFMANHAVAYAPETRWKYSNLALTLAGLIVEKVSGEKYADYIQAHIFDPLGMTESSWDKNVPGLATGYTGRLDNGVRKPQPFVDAHAMGAATGLTSTVGDMAKFVSLQFRTGPTGGAQILSTGSLRDMHFVRRLENDWSRGNAIGFFVTRVKDKLYIGHGGAYFGYRTQTSFLLEPKIGVIVLTNSDDGLPDAIAQRAMETIGDAIAKSQPKPKSIPWDPRWSRFAGHYVSSISGAIDVVELNQRLVVIDPRSPNLSSDNKLEPLGNGLFKLEAPTGGSPVGETVRFVEVNGKVTRMYTGGSYRDRGE